MHEINAKLLGLFAATNALFTPARDWSDNRNVSAVLERRAEYHKRGLPVPPAGGDGANRVAAHEEANRLERSGAVKYVRASGKRVAWKLSQGEYLRLSFWSLLDGLAETHLAMRGIAGNWSIGCVINPIKGSPWAFVSEAVLSGCDSVADPELRSRLIMRMEECLLPAMVAGWVNSHSDAVGRVAYQLTPQGWKALTRFPSHELPEYDATLATRTADEYHEAYRHELASLSRLQAERSHISIPLRPIAAPDVEPLPPILDGDARPILDWDAEVAR